MQGMILGKLVRKKINAKKRHRYREVKMKKRDWFAFYCKNEVSIDCKETYYLWYYGYL